MPAIARAFIGHVKLAPPRRAGMLAHEAILGVLSVLLGPQAAALAIVKAAIEALQAMSENRPWLTLFERLAPAPDGAVFSVPAGPVVSPARLARALLS